MTNASNAAASELSPLELAAQAAAVLRHDANIDRYDVALQLGSGWGEAAELIGETVAELPASDVPGFAESGIPGHLGTLRTVRITGTERYALVLGARVHLYEGRGVRPVVHPIRTAAAAGARIAILTNGCGGVHTEWPPGTPVLISDHLNLTATSPLEGATFVDLTDLYSARARAIALGVDPTLREGVYAQFRGPHYETPAEVEMARRMGADLVGMSTGLEAIAAREAGMEVLGLSLVTNHAAGVSGQPLSHAEVLAAAEKAGPRIARLLATVAAKV